VQGEIANYISNFKFLQAADAEEIAKRLSMTKSSGDQKFTAYCEYLTTLGENDLIDEQIHIRDRMQQNIDQIVSINKENEKYYDALQIANSILGQKNADGGLVASETLQYALSKIFYDRTVGRSRFAAGGGGAVVGGSVVPYGGGAVGGGMVVPMDGSTENQMVFTQSPSQSTNATFNIQNLMLNSLNL
jgi:hypothetical protein